MNCLHTLVEQQAQRTPQHTALRFESQELSYQDLDHRATIIAQNLIAAGAEPDQPVGVYCYRNLDLIPCLLGILKAGSAYLPLDPAYPSERTAVVLEQAQPKIILTHSDLAKRITPFSGQLLAIDKLTPREADLPLPHVSPDQLAYVIYTSGSTGTPKGVAVEHQSVVNLVQWAHNTFAPETYRAVLASTSLSFDISVFEIFVPLTWGGTVVLVENVLTLIERQPEVTLINSVPSAIHALVQENCLPASVRVVNLAGEPLSPKLVDQLYALGTVEHVFDLYGPTETTVYSTWTRREAGAPATIGKPIAQTEIVILDDHGNPVTDGHPGELLIGGAGIARGYLNRPDLTAQRFVLHQGRRFYKTGDVVLRRGDGNLIYQGRQDQQVKIRGYRIELGEIESVLHQHPAVERSVVLAHESPSGQKYLVAYLIGNDVPSADLAAFLATKLPEYMIPQAFYFVSAFPTTPNGKLDRSKLVAPQPQRLLDATSYVAPQSELESQLASLWEQVLQTAPIGIHDNFFALGGHSLTAAQIVVRLNRQFQTGLSIRLILEFPTIAQLAPFLRDATQIATTLLHPAPRPEHLSLSFAQERLWFLQELIPESPFYNIPIVTRLRGQLDVRALERSIEQLVERHEALRTIYGRNNDLPIQRIQPPSAHPLMPENVTDVALDTEINQPFDLETGPLFRARLLQVSETEHLLLFLVHHSVADGWSFNLIQKEVRALYRANRLELSAPLPPLSLQYADYALWHRHWLDESRLNQQLTYWKAQLQELPTLTLPTDRPRPPKQSYSGATLSYTLPAELVEQVKAVSKENQVTLFMTLFAIFSALLGRYCTQDDIVIGTPIAGRNQPELEDLVGFFVNTLVLRCDLSDSPSFQELLQRVRRTVLDGFSHQDVPFEKLVEVLQPERDLSRNPLFQVLFVLQEADIAPETVEGVNFALERIPTKTAKFDLNLEIVDNTESLECRWEFSTDLFDPSTIARFHQHFETLLIATMESPAEALPALRLLTDEEQQTLTQTWNATATATPTATTVPALFEQQVRRTPSATALRFGDRSLTYEELDQQANGLAQVLLERGARANVPIALHLHRSPYLIVALLAIWKAGAPYLPLDPKAPLSRKEMLLAQAEVEILLTDTAFPTFEGCVHLYDPAVAPHHAAAAPLVEIALDNLAYVLYTSGSTGTPKGVGMPHRALANLMLWQQGQSDPAPTTLQFTSLGFDVSVQEIASTLTTGGTLVMITEQEQRDSRVLLEIMARENVERLFLPFIALASLAEVATDLKLYPSSLRDIITAGEQLQITPAIATLFRGLPNARLTNQYGPTETHVATAFTLRPPVDTWPPLPPIGTPVANTRVFVLDHRQELVPIGVPGELYIGGEGLAQGYIGAPALTDSRFVSVRGERLYRTGDLVKWDASGQLLFLGRRDHQVKIRGYRVELSDVEAALRTHPAVREAAVVAQELGGGKELVAFVVPTSPDAVTPQALRTYLADRLPEYMIPAFVTFCAELPLTPSGKVDRKALPQIDHQRPLSQKEYTPAQTPEQALLVALWEDVLGVHPIGIHDNFFDLGGHSLRAAQVVARIRNTVTKDISLTTFFEAPTIAQLAVSLKDGHQSVLPPLVAMQGDTPVPLSFGQERFWFLDQLEGNTAHYLLPLLLEYRGELQVDALTTTLQTLLTRHESLRTAFVTQEGIPFAVVGKPEPLCLTVEPFTEEALYTTLETPFVLSKGPLCRFRLWEVAPKHFWLLVVVHHAIADGGSLRLLQQELEDLYKAEVDRHPVILPPCTVQYADYAPWQRQWLSADTLQDQLAYWRTQLEALPILALPTDHSRPPTPSYRGQTQTYVLPAELLTPLKTVSRQNGVTLFMTLLAAFNLLLGRFSGQQDIAIGSPIAGRPLPQLEPLIGFFVNSLVLRNQFEATLPFTEFLGRVKQTTLAAMEHQYLPFEQLVAALNPVRDRSRNPLVQVQFTLLSDPHSRTFTELPPPVVHSALDLSLSITERKDALECRWEFATDLFESATIQQLQRYWVALLTQIHTTPSMPCGAFLQLPASEAEVVHQAGQGCLRTWPERSVVELFEAQVEQNPEAVALICQGETLTYAQLNHQANQLANALQAVGIEAQQIVGIEQERGIPAILSLLAILKIGATYLPLDTSLPPERREFLREQATPTFIISDTFVEHIDHFPSHFSSYPSKAEDIAYVLFTSGSTGKPKGIQIPHHALTNFLLSMQEEPGLTSQAVLLAVTTLSFDIAALEIFLPLITGATVSLATREEATMPKRLIALLEEATHLQATPATWRMLLDAGWTPPPRLTMLCGGEALTHDLAAQLLVNGAALWNLYGPTETTIWSTTKRVERPEEATSIGKPIANTQVCVLDDSHAPVPIGVLGELYIGGDGLAQGYLNRPDLTKERFIYLNGKRFYKTGDCVKWSHNQELLFLGRRDNQVKIRGFRIELQEIEAVLGQHPQVRASAVVVREDRIIAYLVADSLVREELQAFLRRWLPDYMLPTQFFFMDSLPLTPSGKVDRNALQALPEPTAQETSQALPQSPLQRELQKIWQRVLGLRHVGIHDNFFLLGGHSFLAIQLFAQIEQRFQRQLPLATIFGYPTIAELAVLLESAVHSDEYRYLVAIQPRGNRPPLFCVHGAGREVLFYSELAQRLGEDQPLYGIQASNECSGELEDRSIETIARNYLSEVRQIQPEGPYYLCGISLGGMIVYEMAQQLLAERQEVAFVGLFDGGHPQYPQEIKGIPPLCRQALDSFRVVEHHVSSFLLLPSTRKMEYLRTRGFRALREGYWWVTDRGKALQNRLSPQPEYDPERWREWLRVPAERYQPLPYPGHVTLFRAKRQPLGIVPDPTLGWRDLPQGGLTIIEVPGFHAAIVREPWVAYIVPHLKPRLGPEP